MHQPPVPHVASEDLEVAELIEAEARRQFEKIRLIPSENYVSEAVLEASGTVLTNKYSEGYPGRRYYEGQQFIDPIETLAAGRAEALFGVDHANVQPYSGSPANLAVYLAFLEPGETVMGMTLPMGRHLTPGWAQAARPGPEGGPHNPTTAASAVALREAAQPAFGTYVRQVVADAQALAPALLERGYALISGGTDTHLILTGLTAQGIAGKPAAKALDRAGIQANYHTLPFDPRKP